MWYLSEFWGYKMQTYTPFPKHPPIIRINNNADNAIKNCVHKLWTPENNLHSIYERPLRKKDGWACGEGVTFDRALEIIRII